MDSSRAKAEMDLTRGGLEEGALAYFRDRLPELYHSQLGERHFAPGIRRTIFRELVKLAETGAERVDVGVLYERLVAGGHAVSRSALFEIFDFDAVEIAEYERLLERARLKREGYFIAQELASELIDQAGDPQEVLAQKVELLMAVIQGSTETHVHSYPEALAASAQAILERPNRTADGVTTGWATLDQALGGLPRGAVTIVGGRPGHGKSSLVQQACEQVARRGGRVLLCTAEMSVDQVAARGLARHLRIDLRNLRRHNLVPAEEERLRDFAPDDFATEAGKPVDFFLYDAPAQTVGDIVMIARRCAGAGQLELVGVDYVQFLDDQRQREETRQQSLGRIMRTLKALARDLGCALLVGAQLKREVEAEDREPRLSDLRESGDLEQDADLVLLLHRTSEEEVRVIAAKNRQGSQGAFPLRFRAGFTEFVDGT